MLTLALALSMHTAPPPLSVGFAKVDITPDIAAKPVYMAGFGHNRVAKTIHDPLYAYAMVLSDGTDRLAFVSVDVVGLFLPTIERARAKLPGYKYVLVSSTHNHEGPDTMGLWGSSPIKTGVDPAYLTKVVDDIAKAVRLAGTKLTPVTARIGNVKGPELLHDGRDPQVKHDDIVAIRFDSAAGKPAGLWVQWNVHPELMDSKNTAITADHVGYTVDYLEKKYGCPVAYYTGAIGGLMTSLKVPLTAPDGTPLKDGTFEKTAVYGRKVGELADRALSGAKPVALTPFEVRSTQLLVPMTNPLYKLATTAGVLHRDIYPWTGNPRPAEFKPVRDITGNVAVKTELGYLRLGDLDLAAIPGEIYPELVIGGVPDPAPAGADFPDAPIEPSVYAQMRPKHRMIFGLANDELGYFLPKRQWDEKPPFTYGRTSAPYGEVNSVGPDTAPVLLKAFRELATR